MNPRAELVAHLVHLYRTGDSGGSVQFVWEAVTAIMEYAGTLDLAGMDKKAEALAILKEVLDQTDFRGPDQFIDPLVMLLAETGIDFLYKAYKGEFNFGG